MNEVTEWKGGNNYFLPTITFPLSSPMVMAIKEITSLFYVFIPLLFAVPMLFIFPYIKEFIDNHKLIGTLSIILIMVLWGVFLVLIMEVLV